MNKSLVLLFLILLSGCSMVAPVHQPGNQAHPFASDFPQSAKLVGQYQKYTLTGASEALIVTSIDGVQVFDASATRDSVLHLPAGQRSIGYYHHRMRAAARATVSFVAKEMRTYRLRAERVEGSDNVRFWIEDAEGNHRVSDDAIEPMIDTGRRPLPLLIALP